MRKDVRMPEYIRHTHYNTHTQSSSIRVFSSNVRGLVKSWDAIKQIDLTKYEVLMFNEIWQIRDFENVSIPDFKIASIYQRNLSRGGGTIIYVRETIKTESVSSPISIGIIETTAVAIENNIFVSLYRPPAGNKLEFVEALSNWITGLGNKNIYVAGDFNINNLNNDRAHFESIEALTGLTAQIAEITRVESNSCIDNILSNIEGKHTVSTICIADHQAITSKIKINLKKEHVKRFKYREMKDRNWNSFSEELTKIVIRGSSIDEKWNNVTSDIKLSIKKAFPEKETNKQYKFIMSQGLLKSKNTKNKLLKRYKRGSIDKEVYIRYNKIYRKLISKELEASFHEKLNKSGADYKKKWRILKSELKLSQNRENIEAIQKEGNLITDKKAIAQEFKNHFETCATKLARGVPNSQECNILIEQQNDWEFKETNIAELEKIIDSILPKSSCGFDLLTNKMLKKEKTKFSKLLITLINETLKSGIFPEVLKTAKVIPIFKKGDKTNLNNYRPISLLPVLSKILEKIINKQITNKLDELHLIDDDQYGFRTGHSTEDAVVKFIDQIEKAKQTHRHVISIHIDVSKAFDSCNHNILTSKLRRIGISGNSLELMKSYLTNRVQELWLENECGGKFVINIGVGQGTVLGPTLFKIYIMDMYLSTNLFSLRFADDSNVISKSNDRETIERVTNEELEKLHKWFCSNKLTLHPDKSRYIIHTRDKLINIKLGNKNLMRCGYGLQEEGVKFLGVIIDENLDWKLQTAQVRKKIGKGNYLLWRYRNRLTINMKRTIYESFIRTHITYCLSIWGAKKTALLTELKKVVKKSWSKIGIRHQHTNERLAEHKILKLEDELVIAESKIIWRWIKNKLPLGLKTIICERGQRNLRRRQFVRSTEWKQDSISYRLATRASKDFEEISIARSKKGLVKKLKNKYLLVTYNTQCRTRNCFICTQTAQRQ